MGKLMEHVKTANSVLRTGIMLVVLAGAAYGGYLTYTNYVRPGLEANQAREDLQKTNEKMTALQASFDQLATQSAEQQKTIDAQAQLMAELSRAKEQLEMANKLLKIDHRLARIKVLEKGQDPGNNEKYCLVEFSEVDDQGNPIGVPKTFRLKGERLYIDAFIVKFDDQFVESSDALRSTSMYMFRRIFGEDDGLEGGYPLDVDDQGIVHAAAYVRGSRLTEFEQKIWREFWAISNDPEKQKEMGVRNNHGQINYIDPLPGQVYEFTLRSSDGLSFNVVNK
jgi:hypothetical protein